MMTHVTLVISKQSNYAANDVFHQKNWKCSLGMFSYYFAADVWAARSEEYTPQYSRNYFPDNPNNLADMRQRRKDRWTT